MDQHQLHKRLTELHGQLTSARPVDAANRRLLEQLAGDIHLIMTRAPNAVEREQYGTLRERLVNAAAALEVSHPSVAKAVEGIVDTLAFFNL